MLRCSATPRSSVTPHSGRTCQQAVCGLLPDDARLRQNAFSAKFFFLLLHLLFLHISLCVRMAFDHREQKQ